MQWKKDKNWRFPFVRGIGVSPQIIPIRKENIKSFQHLLGKTWKTAVDLINMYLLHANLTLFWQRKKLDEDNITKAHVLLLQSKNKCGILPLAVTFFSKIKKILKHIWLTNVKNIAYKMCYNYITNQEAQIYNVEE